MRIALMTLLMTVAGCSGETGPIANTEGAPAASTANDTAAVDAGFQPPTPAPLATVSVDPVDTPAPGALLPSADRQYRYIGSWAPSAALCASAAWRFETRKLTTAGDVSCDLPTLAAVPTGFKLQGTCGAGRRKLPETIDLSFDESKRTMRVASIASFPSVELIYCGV